MSENDTPGTIKADDGQAVKPAAPKPSQPAQAAQAAVVGGAAAAASGAANVATPTGKAEPNIVADMLGKALYDPAKGKANWMGIGITGGLAVLGALVSGMFGLGTLGTIIGLLAGAVGGVALMGSGVVDKMTGDVSGTKVVTKGQIKSLDDPNIQTTKSRYAEKLKDAARAYTKSRDQNEKDEVVREHAAERAVILQKDLNDFYATAESIRKQQKHRDFAIEYPKELKNFELNAESYASMLYAGKNYDELASYEKLIAAKVAAEKQIELNKIITVPSHDSFLTIRGTEGSYMVDIKNTLENAGKMGTPQAYEKALRTIEDNKWMQYAGADASKFNDPIKKMQAIVEANKVLEFLHGQDGSGGQFAALSEHYKGIIDKEIQRQPVAGQTVPNALAGVEKQGSQPGLGE